MDKIENPNIREFGYYNDNRLTHAVFYIFSVLTLGLLYLVFEWFPHLQLWLYTTTDSYISAEYVICFKIDGTFVRSVIVKEKRTTVPGEEPRDLVYFYLDHQIYYYSKKNSIFKKIENKFMHKLAKDPRSIEIYDGGLEETSVRSLRLLYGYNEIDIKIHSVFYYIWEEVKTPIMLFEFVAAVVFAFNRYFTYAVALIIFVGFTCITIAFDAKNAKQKMYEKANTKQILTVVRKNNGAIIKKKISSLELVIGDIVLVQTHDVFTCDMLMIKGTCLVSEAILTGESNPIAKTGLFNNPNDGISITARNQLYSGANCVVSKTKEVKAIVIRSGWNTTKGNLIADVINTKATEFKFKSDVYKVLGIMLVIAMVCCIALFYIQVTYMNFDWSSYIGKSLEILTTALPPALFFSFTMGLELANKRLKSKNIFSLIIEKINEGGRVKYIGFDKTGTLTETTVNVASYLSTEDFEKNDGSNKLFELYNSKYYRGILEVMSCCHSLNIVQDEPAGDPLDEEMFKATKFSLEEAVDDTTGVIRRYINPSAEFKRKFNLGYNYKYEILATNEFTPERKCVSVVIRGLSETKDTTLLKGAPEQVKLACDPSSIPANYDAILSEYSEKGYRILALAQGDVIGKGYDVEKNLDFLGFVLLTNPLKEETKETLRQLKEVDIEVFMVTGDNLYTSLNVSFNSGMLAPNASMFIGEYNSVYGIRFTYFSNKDIRSRMSNSYIEDNNERSMMSVKTHMVFSYNDNPDTIRMILNHCKRFAPTKIALEGKVFEELFVKTKTNDGYLSDFFEYALIFARSNPDQKAMIVEKLKDVIKSYRSSYCVAFVGDGSNDCKALKTANIGLSLGNNESSIASAFNTDKTNIGPIIDLLLEGRASLEVAMQNFKFIMVSCFIQFFSIVMLLLKGLDFTNADYYLFDIFSLIPLSALMSQTSAADKLTKNLPRISIINNEIVLSIVGHLIFASVSILMIMKLITDDVIYKETYDAIGETSNVAMDEYHFYQNKLMIIAVDLMTLTMCLAVNRGYPFRKTIFSNFYFLAYVLVLCLMHLYILVGFELKWHTWDYCITAFTRQPTMNDRLRYKFGLFVGSVCLVMFLFEKMINGFYLTKKRRLNQLASKGKEQVLAKHELKAMDDLMDSVSLN